MADEVADGVRVGDLVDCRRCGTLMLVSRVREDLCGLCWRRLTWTANQAVRPSDKKGRTL